VQPFPVGYLPNLARAVVHLTDAARCGRDGARALCHVRGAGRGGGSTQSPTHTDILTRLLRLLPLLALLLPVALDAQAPLQRAPLVEQAEWQPTVERTTAAAPLS